VAPQTSMSDVAQMNSFGPTDLKFKVYVIIASIGLAKLSREQL